MCQGWCPAGRGLRRDADGGPSTLRTTRIHEAPAVCRALRPSHWLCDQMFLVLQVRKQRPGEVSSLLEITQLTGAALSLSLHPPGRSAPSSHRAEPQITDAWSGRGSSFGFPRK